MYSENLKKNSNQVKHYLSTRIRINNLIHVKLKKIIIK